MRRSDCTNVLPVTSLRRAVTARFGVASLVANLLCLQQGMSDVLAALIARGASFELRNDRNETPVHKAAKHSRFDCLELLVSSGARLEAQDELGRSPLMRAVEAGPLDDPQCFLFDD
jgi:ankyrin repeat protein